VAVHPLHRHQCEDGQADDELTALSTMNQHIGAGQMSGPDCARTLHSPSANP